MSEKQKTYDTKAEFEADRAKMWREGWLVSDQRKVPATKPRWPGTGPGPDSIFALVLLSPFILLGWLLYRNAPEEQIVVTYRRGG